MEASYFVVVITSISVPFALKEVDNGSIFKLLWQPFLRSHRVEQACEDHH